jgi:hypothetical protein
MEHIEYFKHLEDLEKDELYLDDVLYHFKTALELERDGEPIEYTEIEDIYEQYKHYKSQKLQVKFLKMIYQPEQRSPDWYEIRKTMITASDIAAVVGAAHGAEMQLVCVAAVVQHIKIEIPGAYSARTTKQGSILCHARSPARRIHACHCKHGLAGIRHIEQGAGDGAVLVGSIECQATASVNCAVNGGICQCGVTGSTLCSFGPEICVECCALE